MGTHGEYPPPQNPNPDPQRSLYMGDLDPWITLPMSIPTGILASTRGDPDSCPALAGTGSSKTMPFMLPLLLDKKKKVVILSSLKVLQEDQVSSFFILQIGPNIM